MAKQNSAAALVAAAIVALFCVLFWDVLADLYIQLIRYLGGI